MVVYEMINRRERKGFRRGRRGKKLCAPLRIPPRPLRLIILIVMLTCALPIMSQTKLLETGRATKLAELPKTVSDVRVVSYNIRWRTGNELQQIARWLKDKNDLPRIVALQEVDRAKKRTGKVNNARALAEELGLYYAWAAPPPPKNDDAAEEETGVELLSSFPLKDVIRIVLPHTGPAGRSRVALGATVDVGDVEVRIYSVHSETRIPVTDKMEQLQTVIDDANRFPKTRAIIMGDFNTWELPAVESTRQLFTAAGFDTPFSDDDTTFLRKVPLLGIKLKLDWIWLRGVSVQTYDIDRTIAVSDHFPLGVVATPQVSPGRSSPSISK